MTEASCAAIDLGSSTGRVAVVSLAGERLAVREVSRFDTPVTVDGETGWRCWDLAAIEARVREGLARARALAPVASVGVDSWGVDYVLLDGAHAPTAPAVCYRDDRTRGLIEEICALRPAADIYRRTGVQFAPYNTLYQLAATRRRAPAWLARARRLLMIPDYFHFRLCGALANEHTQATTTQLLSIATGDWDPELLALAGAGRELFSTPVAPGTPLGEMTAAGWEGVAVVATGTHDTASAVAAIPVEGEDEAFISSGTWSLMGVEIAAPRADETARRLNFGHEGGVGSILLLKNIVGLFLAQRLRQELAVADHEAVVAAAASAPPFRAVIDPEDPRFLNPPSMVEALRGFCRETGQPPPGTLAELARCVFDSLALSYRRVKEELELLRGRRLARIHIVGGGAQNGLLDQLCADACRLPVSAGPVETSTLGNACVQLIALGALPSLAAARACIRRSFAVEHLEPREAVPEEVWRRFQGFPHGYATGA
jgi:rhamnulokinase